MYEEMVVKGGLQRGEGSLDDASGLLGARMRALAHGSQSQAHRMVRGVEEALRAPPAPFRLPGRCERVHVCLPLHRAPKARPTV
jgi:hypothetical protein